MARFEDGHPKYGGRQKGTLNKQTLAGMRLAESLISDEKYLKAVRRQLRRDELPPEFISTLWDRAFGKVVDPNIHPAFDAPPPPPPAAKQSGAADGDDDEDDLDDLDDEDGEDEDEDDETA